MIEIRHQEDVLHLKGRFDATQVERAEAALGRLTASTVVDIAELDFLSSAGIAVFVRAYKRLQAEGRTLRLRSANDRIRDVLRFSGLDRILLID